ncbi:complement C1q-like protein 4 [Mya arenaria]|uniref:complement C1q-like protein 4 n=1 Tax=Mya arenaria TaxID=6604 RepID=UPI0022DFCDF2|nr:complement C1q-like protein 4 [Mya arenaria]
MKPLESKAFPLKRQTIPEQVAFHAFQDGNKCIQNKQTLVYEHAPINEGNGYSSSDGIFDAPLAGLYVFTWTVADFHDWYATELMADGVSRGATIADNGDTDIATGTAIVVVKLNAGSHVFVRRSIGGGCNVVNIAERARNSFSGWLLFPAET